MYVKCKPYTDKPDIWTAIWNGPIFIGLGSPGEIAAADDAIAKGAVVQWVEAFTWAALDRISHGLCDNPRPVAPVVTTIPVAPAPAPAGASS